MASCAGCSDFPRTESTAYGDAPSYPTCFEGTTPFAQLDDIRLEEPGALAELKTHTVSLNAFVQEWLQSQQYMLERASRNIREQKSLIATGGYIEEEASPHVQQPLLDKFRPAEWQPSPALATPNAKAMPTARSTELDDVVRRTLSALEDIREQMKGKGEEREEYRETHLKALKEHSFSKLSTTSGTDFDNMGMPPLRGGQEDVGAQLWQEYENKQPKPNKTLLKKMVSSKSFESLCALVIFGNAIFMGYASDFAMHNLHVARNPTFSLVELSLCIFYTSEVLLRFCAHGRNYLCGLDWKWNVFDLILVIFAVYDQFETFLAITHGFGALENMSFLRMMRLMKMLKLLRMVRLMRMFKELRLILNSIMGSVKSMWWSLVLITTFSYMFGICFLQACTAALKDENLVLSPKTQKGIGNYWSSVSTSMHSLYIVSTNGEDWPKVAEPLWEVGGLFYFLFMIYIAFFLFVVINTLTSLFVELTIAQSEQDTQMAIQLELDKKDMYIKRLQAFYDKMDYNQDGSITYDEFCTHLNDPEVRAFASCLDIEVVDTKQFFCILSNNGTRAVDLETFVVGCIKLRGMAKSMDLMDLIFAHKQATHEHRNFARSCLERLKAMELLMLQGRQKTGSGTRQCSKDSAERQPAQTSIQM